MKSLHPPRRRAALLALAGLPLLPLTAPAQGADPCAGLTHLPSFVEGEPSAAFVDNLRTAEDPDAAINGIVRSLGIDLPRDQLVELLNQINEDPTRVDYTLPVPEAMQGLAGLSVTATLTSLLLERPQVMTGKIRDYVYVDQTKSGHLSVDVCINNSRFYHWDVEVPDDLYVVHERSEDPANYPDNPFPNLDLSLPEMAIDPDNDRSIWARNLRFKLSAEGARIRVRNVYYRDVGTPDLVRLEDGHPYYTSTADSCVDLFTTYYPPATFGELVGNDYCLGRCRDPAIINTGG